MFFYDFGESVANIGLFFCRKFGVVQPACFFAVFIVCKFNIHNNGKFYFVVLYGFQQKFCFFFGFFFCYCLGIEIYAYRKIVLECIFDIFFGKFIFWNFAFFTVASVTRSYKCVLYICFADFFPVDFSVVRRNINSECFVVFKKYGLCFIVAGRKNKHQRNYYWYYCKCI